MQRVRQTNDGHMISPQWSISTVSRKWSTTNANNIDWAIMTSRDGCPIGSVLGVSEKEVQA